MKNLNNIDFNVENKDGKKLDTIREHLTVCNI